MNMVKRVGLPGLALALVVSAGAAGAGQAAFKSVQTGRPQTAHHDRNHDRHGRPSHRRDYYHRDRRAYRHDWRYRPGFGYHYYRPTIGYWPHYNVHGFRHRYFHGSHYYYNDFGFYFPGFGFIHYGHRHGSHCPSWHFSSFAAGAVLGAVINR